jgi:hypothetical protein
VLFNLDTCKCASWFLTFYFDEIFF